MPHSSSGFGEINIDRIYLVERENAKETSDKKLTLEGQESSPPASVALVRFLHGQIVSLEDGRLVPVVFRDKAVRNGYYTVTNSSSDITDYQGSVVMADWTISLERIGADTDVDLQSRLTGAARQNNFSQTGTKWHAPSIGHYAYNTGSTNPTSTLTRTGSDGAITVYIGIPANIAPRWGCAVANYKTGRVKIIDTSEVSNLTESATGTLENELEGVNRNISASAWSLSNGLVNITPTVTAGVVDVQSYSGGAFHSKLINIQSLGANIAVWSSATILRNDFEMCVVRLVAANVGTQGRTQLDLTLRRGSRFVEGYLQCTTSTTLSVHARTAETTISNQSSSGYVTRTTGDTDSNRFVAGSARTFTSHANGGLTKTSTTFLDFYWGATIGGAGSTNDTAPDLQAQYIGAMPEITYAVKR